MLARRQDKGGRDGQAPDAHKVDTKDEVIIEYCDLAGSESSQFMLQVSRCPVQHLQAAHESLSAQKLFRL